MWPTAINFSIPIVLAVSFVLGIGSLALLKVSAAKKISNFQADALNSEHVWLLRRYTPTAQIELLEKVLLGSLAKIYTLLQAIPVNEGQTLLDFKLTELISLFKRIQKQPTFLNTTANERTKNQAIFIFVFYRVLLRDVLDKAIKNKILSPNTEPWIFLKRVPTQLEDLQYYLGAQSWRLYEFKTLVFGEIAHLELNVDIKFILESLLSPFENGEENPNSEKQPAKAQNKEFDVNALKKSFYKWLKKQIDSWPINESGRFFVDIKRFDKRVLFISERALADFSKSESIALKTLTGGFKKEHILSSSEYSLENSKGKKIEHLFKATIKFDTEVFFPLNHKIVEVPYEPNY